HVPLSDLSHLRGASPHIRNHITTYLTSVVKQLLARFVDNPVEFRQLLDDTQSALSGSSVLHVLLQCTPFESWSPSDLDVYVPLTAADRILQYLTSHGYTVIAYPRLLSPDVMEYGSGIAAVIKLQGSMGEKIDVIISTRMSALYPITFFWGTPVMNWVKNGELGLAYPRATLAGVGYINPDRAYHHKVLACKDKYEARRFRLQEFDEHSPVHSSQKVGRAYCPQFIRHFKDKHCLTFRLTDAAWEAGQATDLDVFPRLFPFWSFGQDTCWNGCAGA
ncbi:hypothetical protein DENSPDRAFT_755334, partial [Dentipellis sp. KUC8613]